MNKNLPSLTAVATLIVIVAITIRISIARTITIEIFDWLKLTF